MPGCVGNGCLLTKTLAGCSGVRPLLENVILLMTGCFDMSCTPQLWSVSGTSLGPGWTRIRDPHEETRLGLLLLDFAPHVGVLLTPSSFLSPVCVCSLESVEGRAQLLPVIRVFPHSPGS